MKGSSSPGADAVSPLSPRSTLELGEIFLPAFRCEPPLADQQTHRVEPVFRMYVP
jgi:hypothetical protein